MQLARLKDLLDPSALEESGIRCVLFDVGRFALFVGILRMIFLVRGVSRRLGIWCYALVAPIGGWDRRHATGHWISLCDVGALDLRPKRCIYREIYLISGGSIDGTLQGIASSSRLGANNQRGFHG
jgi:hypothetical protein